MCRNPICDFHFAVCGETAARAFCWGCCQGRLVRTPFVRGFSVQIPHCYYYHWSPRSPTGRTAKSSKMMAKHRLTVQQCGYLNSNITISVPLSTLIILFKNIQQLEPLTLADLTNAAACIITTQILMKNNLLFTLPNNFRMNYTLAEKKEK